MKKLLYFIVVISLLQSCKLDDCLPITPFELIIVDSQGDNLLINDLIVKSIKDKDGEEFGSLGIYDDYTVIYFTSNDDDVEFYINYENALSDTISYTVHRYIVENCDNEKAKNFVYNKVSYPDGVSFSVVKENYTQK